jgi:hypothetical protein
MMDYEKTANYIESTLASVSRHFNTFSSEINLLADRSYADIGTIEKETEIVLAVQDSLIARHVVDIALNAEYHLARAYFHASPAFVAILSGIVKVVGWIVKFVKTLTNSKIFKVLHSLHKIAIELIPGYQVVINRAAKAVSDFSKQIGIGTDGIRHFINAMQASKDVAGAMLGWDEDDFISEWMTTSAKTLETISAQATNLSKDPQKWFDEKLMFYKDESNRVLGKKWQGIFSSVEDSVVQVQEIAETVGTVTSELNQFAESLPDFIKDNIPQAIYDALNAADTAINDNIIPKLSKLSTKLDEVNNVIDKYSKKLSDITDKIDHPGDVLLGVDNLPDYVRINQEQMIDDVSSRELTRQIENETQAMSERYAELDTVMNALKNPPPSPGFLGIEEIKRPISDEIVAEPHETWFVGDY